MKTRIRRIRKIRRQALAGAAVAVLAISGAAGAAQPKPQLLTVQNAVQMPGFAPSVVIARNTPSSEVAPRTGTNLATWLKVELLKKNGIQSKLLKKDGFVAGSDEPLSSTPGSPEGYGDSTVWIFKTAAGAKAYAAYNYTSSNFPRPADEQYKSLDVGVAGAKSILNTDSKGLGANTYFAVGHCAVWMGAAYPNSDSGHPTPGTAVAAGAKAVAVQDAAACK